MVPPAESKDEPDVEAESVPPAPRGDDPAAGDKLEDAAKGDDWGAADGSEDPGIEGGVSCALTGFGACTVGGGLRPPGDSSVAPIGIPVRGTGVSGLALPAAVVPRPAVAHVPEAVPVVPPPSNGAVDAMAASIFAPAPEHGEPAPAAAPNDKVPPSIGLRPGEFSSVAPSGTPGGPTGVPGPTSGPMPAPVPSGDVIPREGPRGGPRAGPRAGLVSATCARAGPQFRTRAATKPTVTLFIMSVLSSWLVARQRDVQVSHRSCTRLFFAANFLGPGALGPRALAALF